MSRTAVLGALLLVLLACEPGDRLTSAQQAPVAAPRVLVFSKTAGFRHDSIDAARDMIEQLGEAHEFVVDSTEDGAQFTDANLSGYRVVVFLMTTGDVLDTMQQSAFERYIRAGGGFVGIHSASDTEYDWLWYGRLVGAYFANHPPGLHAATIHVEDRTHRSTSMLPEQWQRTDEWYNFRANPRSSVTVLASLDETTYEGGSMQGDHPIAWYHVFDGGRSWYTGGGHTRESYAEPLFQQHVLGGILWAAGLPAAAGEPQAFLPYVKR